MFYNIELLKKTFSEYKQFITKNVLHNVLQLQVQLFTSMYKQILFTKGIKMPSLGKEPGLGKRRC